MGFPGLNHSLSIHSTIIMRLLYVHKYPFRGFFVFLFFKGELTNPQGFRGIVKRTNSKPKVTRTVIKLPKDLWLRCDSFLVRRPSKRDWHGAGPLPSQSCYWGCWSPAGANSWAQSGRRTPGPHLLGITNHGLGMMYRCRMFRVSRKGVITGGQGNTKGQPEGQGSSEA